MEQNKFNQWADAYFTKNKHNHFLRFQQCIDDCNIKFGINLSKEAFRGCLLRWCDQYGYALNPHNMLDDNRNLLRNFKGFDGVQEAIYIKNPNYAKQPEAISSQWEIFIRFKGDGYYDGNANTFADAVRIATGFGTLVEIETLRIEAVVSA